MAQAVVNFEIDEELKNDMAKICKENGITVEDAFVMFAKKMVSTGSIPFEDSLDPFYSIDNMERLERAIEDAGKGYNMHEHDLIEVEE